jgi:3',5'-cyclic AMP phosphodiesterase CpdA
MLAQITDPHMDVGPGDQGSAAALAAGVAEVLALDPAPDAVVVTGDLAEHASAAEYERVRELLAPLPMPVHVIPGNHDDRDVLRAHFPSPPGERVQYAVDAGDLRLLACDTSIPGEIPGRLDLAWVEAELAAVAEAGRPVVLAMHHPPVGIGQPVLDDAGLPEADRSGLAELLRAFPAVRRIVAGHYHRTAFGVLAGCGVAVCPSVHLQSRLEIGGTDFELVAEPPAIALHLTRDGDVVSHVQPVMARA